MTLLARQLEPEAGHFNKGLCGLPGGCSRKLLCQAPEWKQCPSSRGTENALKGQMRETPGKPVSSWIPSAPPYQQWGYITNTRRVPIPDGR